MKYDIVIVLCPDKKGKDDRFPEFKDGQYLGGQTRMDATIEIYKENKETKFILVGGYNKDNWSTDNYKESQKTIDMENYMINKEVSKEKIFRVNSLPSTKHNLVAVFNKYKNDLENVQNRIGLLTNFYHLPRVLGFWAKLITERKFKKINNAPKPIIAESMAGGGMDDMQDIKSIFPD